MLKVCSNRDVMWRQRDIADLSLVLYLCFPSKRTYHRLSRNYGFIATFTKPWLHSQLHCSIKLLKTSVLCTVIRCNIVTGHEAMYNRLVETDVRQHLPFWRGPWWRARAPARSVRAGTASGGIGSGEARVPPKTPDTASRSAPAPAG